MRTASLLAAFMAAMATCLAVAQQQPAADKKVGSKVFIGQSLEDAKAVLTRSKIGFAEGGFSFSKGDPDESNLCSSIDDRHTSACIWYSISKSQVTKISMVFRPHLQATKTEQSWLRASELEFHEDQSYTVRFRAPFTAEEIKKLEENRPQPQVPPPWPKPSLLELWRLRLERALPANPFAKPSPPAPIPILTPPLPPPPEQLREVVPGNSNR